ncbi:MAG: triose-phosphate isomerase [Pseudomonadota bacterium]|nr:triose-phosphate isomerase [Pseudomonadota bacterium]
MRSRLVAGNWKMNGSLASVRALAAAVRDGSGALAGVEVAVFPPFVYLPEVSRLLAATAVRWGAQNLSEQASGAYTGEVAASMLRDFDCTYVLVGHSERRTLYGETDAVVAKKFAAARSAGLKPMLCIGETLEERERGVTEEVVARQLDAVIDAQGVGALADAVIAYEPVWAIGTGRTASPDQAQAVHAFIRGYLRERSGTIADSALILYGGSVKSSNAAELFAMADIDGGLVGGASLDAAEFLGIVKAAT